MRYIPSSVCIIGDLLCVGCCGNIAGTKEEVDEAIRKNTIEYDSLKDKKEFAARIDQSMLRKCGICRNIIYKDGKALCPLHPKLNESDDLRDFHCDRSYLCKAASLYNDWDDKKKESFISFVKEKKLGWFDFSIGMDNNSLLEEFESKGI